MPAHPGSNESGRVTQSPIDGERDENDARHMPERTYIFFGLAHVQKQSLAVAGPELVDFPRPTAS